MARRDFGSPRGIFILIRAAQHAALSSLLKYTEQMTVVLEGKPALGRENHSCDQYLLPAKAFSACMHVES